MKIINSLIYSAIIFALTFWIIESLDAGKILIFSQDSLIIEIEEYDELFDTTTVKTETKYGYWFGLLPADDSVSLKSFLSLIPILSILIAWRIINFILVKYKLNKTKEVEK